MGTAHLLGQLRLPSEPFTALPLLRQAYETATIDFPQPAYVYGMLLAGELVTSIAISPSLSSRTTPPYRVLSRTTGIIPRSHRTSRIPLPSSSSIQVRLPLRACRPRMRLRSSYERAMAQPGESRRGGGSGYCAEQVVLMWR